MTRTRAGDGHDQQHRGELEREDVVAVEARGELLDVGVVVAPSPIDEERPLPGLMSRRLGCRDDRRDRQADEADGHHGGEGSLELDRLDAQVLGLVDAEHMMTNRNSTTMAPA